MTTVASQDFDALIFDFDGVLADSVEVKAEAFGALYRAHGKEIVQRVMTHHREHGGMTRREKFRIWHKDFLGIELDDAGVDALSAAFSKLVVDNVVAADEIPGATDFARHWSGKVICLVDSASPDDELSIIMERRGLTPYFKQTLGSANSKTKNLEILLERYTLAPDRVIFFGDAGSDHAAATACGTRFIGILPGPDAPLLKKQPGITWFTNFHEVQAHLAPEVSL